MAALIDIRGAGVAYQAKTGSIEALKDVSFSVADNEFVSVIGPSGCGKTTLLKLVGGLLRPSSGEVAVRGGPAEAARRRREFGFVFQNPVLMPWRTVLGNLRFPAEIVKSRTLLGGAEPYEELLKLVGIADFRDNHPHELSGGMQQRVAIARALVLNPSILLMDEPFGALDEITRERMNRELLRIWAAVKHTILFVTHSIPEAVFLSDRIVVLSPRPGRVAGIVKVDLPRPREPGLRFTEAFTALLREAHGLLNDEA